MPSFYDFKQELRKCSKCGLCHTACPLYKVTGNDCTVSRGQFGMLYGVVQGKFKVNKIINKYLDLCLKCNSCSKACPAGIDVVDIITSAKAEFFKTHPFEKLISLFQNYLLLGVGVNLAKIGMRIISPFNRVKSKKFDKKVLYFGGCGSKVLGDRALTRILNSLSIEVINPVYHCCGIPFLSRGDIDTLNEEIEKFVKITQKYDIREIVVSCASCEGTLKNYIKWVKNEDSKEFLKTLKIKNVYEYIHENKLKLKLKTPKTVTYHKPCHINNFEDIKWILENTENLNYVESVGFDECCGLNGITKINEYKTLLKIYLKKRKQLKNSGAKVVLTSCLGCEGALNLYSFGAYKTVDLLRFIEKNISL